ncbi:MAG: AraC family transcriptional regulator [Lachnospiraceae bacterium]|nr:AraC family transcriptional regulator [Lachnospiraceae bacterium]
MNKDLHCPYSILDTDILCEHKSARIEQPNTTTLHNHDGYELLFFIAGDAGIFVESEEKKMERGDLILIPPYTFHGIRVANIEQYERIVLNFRPHVLEEAGDDETDFVSFFQSEGNNKLNLISLTNNHINEIVDLLDNLEKSLHRTQFGHTVLSKAYLAEFLVIIANYSNRHPSTEYENIMSPTVKKIFEYIDENIYSELSVEILAHNLHHNSDYLGRIFKNTTGGSLKYFINAKKIAHAQQLLREGYSPCDVCFMLCFNNYSSFSRCFSKHIGLSPKQYVMSLR